MNGRNLLVARASWGEAIPEWVVALAGACDRDNQTRVAQRLGYSPSAVNSILKRSYKGNSKHIQRAVEDGLMQAEVMCPFFGVLLRARCDAYRSGMGLAVVRRSCRGCQHNTSRQDL